MIPLTQVGASKLHHRATLLLRHYPQSAVSEEGRRTAQEYLASSSTRAAHALETLDQKLFVPYIPPLLGRTGWSPQAWNQVMSSVCVLESMYGCVHGCEMCYIDAPPPQVTMPWIHVNELLNEVAAVRRRIIRDEVVDVLVNDVLRGRLDAKCCILDAALAVARHGRNRFGNYSDHLICYWKSNPTNWHDPLLGYDYADLSAGVQAAFQLYSAADLLAAIDADSASTARFQREFGEDASRLLFATSVHAVTSTVPFAQGSLGDLAVGRIIRGNPYGSELVRVSVPHPSLIKTGRGNPDRYWSAVQHSLRTAEPKLVYLFAVNLDQLYELFDHVQSTFTHSDRQWWIESRLGLYEIREGRKRGDSELAIVQRLRSVLRRLSFMARLEGKGKQFAGNPFFSEGSVMCVNGVVLAPERRLHYQACTTPDGANLTEGLIQEGIDTLPEHELFSLLTSRPLTNLARESATRGLDAIPLYERRKAWDWFRQTTIADRNDARYQEAYTAVAPIGRRVMHLMRL